MSKSLNWGGIRAGLKEPLDKEDKDTLHYLLYRTLGRSLSQRAGIHVHVQNGFITGDPPTCWMMITFTNDYWFRMNSKPNSVPGPQYNPSMVTGTQLGAH